MTRVAALDTHPTLGVAGQRGEAAALRRTETVTGLARAALALAVGLLLLTRTAAPLAGVAAHVVIAGLSLLAVLLARTDDVRRLRWLGVCTVVVELALWCGWTVIFHGAAGKAANWERPC